jgi:hypothetical protein
MTASSELHDQQNGILCPLFLNCGRAAPVASHAAQAPALRVGAPYFWKQFTAQAPI